MPHYKWQVELSLYDGSTKVLAGVSPSPAEAGSAALAAVNTYKQRVPYPQNKSCCGSTMTFDRVELGV